MAQFHRRFYDGALTESRPVAAEPACLGYIFDHSNDWLLRPAALQHVVRVLMALGWSPMAIAERIYASYSNDHDWGSTWIRLEPYNRAIFIRDCLPAC
jgi:hypothetical protein